MNHDFICPLKGVA
jgi:serine/threonine protein kinase